MLTNEQYSILAKRLVEEHRKYSDKFGWQFPDNWAEIAVRKVVAQLADFGVTQKVLTDEEIELLKARLSLPKGTMGWSDEELHARWRGVEVTLKYLNDNGYLSPAAGLTVGVDGLAQIIRTVDGNNSLGAGALAEAILSAMEAKTNNK